MRTIKFRGKRIDNGEWVYGYYCQAFRCNSPDKGHYIIRENSNQDYDQLGCDKAIDGATEVDPATVGQFTGLHDKNGEEIYGGDVLLITAEDGEEYEVICEWGIHRRTMDSGCEVDIPSFCFKKASRVTFPIVDNYINKHDLEIMEVIGNIHDNPELLK